MFGGLAVDTLDANRYVAFDRTYEWHDSGWESVQTPVQPERRSDAAMAYDPERQRIVLFGGLVADSTATVNAFVACPTCSRTRQFNDIWTFDGDRWQSAGNGPMAFGGAAVYDAERQALVMIAFRGLASGDDGPKSVGLWTYRDERFVLVDSAGPRSESSPRPAYDTRRKVVVLPIFEGPDAGVWEWNGRWARIQPVTGPEPRRGHVTTYDESRERTLLFGGAHWDGERSTTFNDLWSWDGRQWTRVHDGASDAPAPREDGTLVYDPRGTRLLLLGGLGPGQVLLRETWAFEAGAWRRLQ